MKDERYQEEVALYKLRPGKFPFHRIGLHRPHYMRFRIQLLLMSVLLFASMVPSESLRAQDMQPPKHEFRGAWIATVSRLDWPATNDEATQKARMDQLLNYLQDAGINALFFQVRSSGDAMYASSYEPWSYYLTGQQGRAPTYDPLTYVIQEAHRRGMELHAWINPYRAHNDNASYRVTDSHVTKTHPDWTFKAGPFTWLDPGREEVRDYVSRIVMDIARRYDVDGIHMDDYFYPYPPNHISQQDIETFQTQNRGFSSIQAWRRDNVNLLVAQISDSLSNFNPELKWGISPFGIWKSGVPSGIVGLNAYETIFADATAWIQSQTVDYLVPQLYWPFGGQQDYATLAPWWAQQIRGLHLYIGHALYKADGGRQRFSASEVPNQVTFNRDRSLIQGSVFFRASHLAPRRSRGFAETMRAGLYKYPALTPSMDWKDQTQPPAPFNLTASAEGSEVMLNWDEVQGASGRYAIYRVTSDSAPDATMAAQDARNLIALTGETHFKDPASPDMGRQWYFVQSISHNSVESAPSNLVRSPIATALGREPILTPMSIMAYPTVFADQIQVEYALPRTGEITLEMYDSIGRSVSTLIKSASRQAGRHTLTIPSKEHLLPGGVYWIVLSTAQERVSQAVIHKR